MVLREDFWKKSAWSIQIKRKAVSICLRALVLHLCTNDNLVWALVACARYWWLFSILLASPQWMLLPISTPPSDKQNCLQTLPLASDWEPCLREKVNGNFYGKEPYIWSVIDDSLLKLGHVYSVIKRRSILLQKYLPLFLDELLSPIHFPQIWRSH